MDTAIQMTKSLNIVIKMNNQKILIVLINMKTLRVYSLITQLPIQNLTLPFGS